MINPKLITSKDDWAEREKAEKLLVKKKYNRIQTILIVKALLLTIIFIYTIVGIL